MSDQGLLWDYRLDGVGGGEHTAQAHGSGAFRWCHLQSDSSDARGWLIDEGVSEAVIDSLTISESRPRAMSIAGGTLVVLRGVNSNPGADPEDMISIRIWFDETRILTARRSDRRLLSVEDVRLSIEAGLGPISTGDFVARLVEALANRISVVVDDIDEQLGEIEARLEDDDLVDRRSLSEARRQTARIRRYLAPQRDALDLLTRAKGAALSSEDVYSLRDQADRTMRYVEDLDLARERAIMISEEVQNRIASQQNGRMYVLSLVTAVFLPLSFLTGVFGMNVGGLPGLEDEGAFWILAGCMLLLAIALALFMKLKRWL
ncbi:MAG: zinc transporter ZntB [Pseudomonadaceae bacterium]|nr:zinc transporter ZntB [Pseudomonadaceae bacterium]